MNEVFNHKQINFYSNKNKIISDSIDKLIVKIHSCNKKSLLLTGCGYANGTTTIAINLSIGLAGAGWNVLLIDFDLRKSNKFKRIERTAEYGLYNYLTDDIDWQSVIHSTNIQNMFYIPTGENIENSIQLFYSEKVDKLMYEARNHFDFIILDCPSVTVASDTIALLSKVDKAALIVGLNRTTKKQLAEAESEMKKINEKYCGLIINFTEEKR